MRVTVIAAVMAAAAMCQSKVPSTDAAQCEQACGALRDAGCPEGKPTPKGASCEEVCVNAGLMLPVACVSRAKSENDIQACGVTCAK